MAAKCKKSYDANGTILTVFGFSHMAFAVHLLVFLVRFEVFMVVKMTTMFFWVVTPCRLIGMYFYL
jgi:hypothetical protein